MPPERLAPDSPQQRRLRQQQPIPAAAAAIGGTEDNPGAEQSADGAAEVEREYLFPWWWFVVLCLPNFVLHFVSGPLWSLIWPYMLSQMSGTKYETVALAAGTQIGTVISYAGPLIGSLSDKLPDRYAKYCGRRRPFIIIGCIIGACGIAITIDAMYRIQALDSNPHARHSQYVAAYTELALSLVIGNIGGRTEQSPWVAIIPDTVSIKQRGQCVMIVSWCNTVLAIFGGGMGYMVGQRVSCFDRHPCFSYMDMWWLNVWVLLVVIPIYYVACNGQACDGCSWRGIFKPEQPKPKAAVPEPAQQRTTGNDGAEQPLLSAPAPTAAAQRRCCEGTRQTLADFLVAFRDPCFRWFWIYELNSRLAEMITGSFTLYWYKDCFPHGYYFIHWKIADSAVGATAVNTLIGQVLHIGMMPLVRPDWWRDRFGGRPLLIWASLLSLSWSRNFVYAALTGSPWLYTVIQLWMVWDCFLGCICTSASGALAYDCLPSDVEGRPLAASRDFNLVNLARLIPNTGLPLLLGVSFLWFPNHDAAFKTFFIVGGVINLASLAILTFLVHPKDEPLQKSFQGNRHRYHAAYDALRCQGLAGPERIAKRDSAAEAADQAAAEQRQRALGALWELPQPVAGGARCCDELLFGKGVHGTMQQARLTRAQLRRQRTPATDKRTIVVAGSQQDATVATTAATATAGFDGASRLLGAQEPLFAAVVEGYMEESTDASMEAAETMLMSNTTVVAGSSQRQLLRQRAIN